MDETLKPDRQCAKAAKNAKSIMRSIKATPCLCKIFQKLPKRPFFVSFWDAILFTEPTWLPSLPILLVQPSPSGRTCYPFDGRRTHSGLRLPRLRKSIWIRQPSVSTSQAEVFRHRWTCAELNEILHFRSIILGPYRRRSFLGGSLS